jgi:hypothetical protein
LFLGLERLPNGNLNGFPGSVSLFFCTSYKVITQRAEAFFVSHFFSIDAASVVVCSVQRYICGEARLEPNGEGLSKEAKPPKMTASPLKDHQ